MQTMLLLDHQDIRQRLPYAVICETREGSRWNTGKCCRAIQSEFTQKECKALSHIYAQARKWTLTTGVPDSIMMTVDTYRLWQRLGQVCASLY